MGLSEDAVYEHAKAGRQLYERLSRKAGSGPQADEVPLTKTIGIEDDISDFIDVEPTKVTERPIRHVDDFSKDELMAPDVVDDERVRRFLFNPEYTNPYSEYTDDVVEARLYKMWRLAQLKVEKEKEDRAQQEARLQIEEFERKNKLLFFGKEGKGYLGRYGKWEPNPAQLDFFSAFEEQLDVLKIFLLTGANRISKTFTFTGIIPISLCIGRYPWEDPSAGTWIWDKLGWKPPIMGRIVGQDWLSHIKGVVIPTMKELTPESFGVITRKNQVGVEAFWEYPNGSMVEVMSNSSESDVFEGKSLHFVVFDEPPTRDIWVACSRGLVDTNGLAFFAMTLLKEAWVDRDVINRVTDDGLPDPTVFHISAEMTNNLGFGISQQGMEQFKKNLNEDEIQARIFGVPSYKSGLILKIDRNKHYINPEKDFKEGVPSHWPVDVAIDIGVAKPHDVMFKAVSESGFSYVIHAAEIRGDGTAIADYIIKYIERHSLRLNRVIVDPLSKSDRNNENTTFEKIDVHLNRFGYYLETGSKQKEDGILAINNALSSQYGVPSLYFFRDASKKMFRQLENWMYEDNGKPSKEDDDACENLYRLMLLGTKYEEMEDSEIPPEPFVTNGNGGRNPRTGY